jgi:hypothetical protein
LNNFSDNTIPEDFTAHSNPLELHSYVNYGRPDSAIRFIGEIKDLAYVNTNSLGHNIGLDPQWVNPLENDLRLQPTSPLIDAGPDGNTDYGARQDNIVFTVSDFVDPEVVDKIGRMINSHQNDFGTGASFEEFTDINMRKVRRITIREVVPGDNAASFSISKASDRYLPGDLDANHIIGEAILSGRTMKIFTMSELPLSGSVSKSINADTLPPLPPQNVKAVILGNDVSLSWLQNSEPDLAASLIFRSTVLPVKLSSINQIASLPKDATTFTDFGKGASSLNYVVIAIDSAGNYSKSREVVSSITIFVDDNGSDQNGEGSQAKPYKTITKAASKLPINPATSYAISIFPGVYNEGVKLINSNRIWTAGKRLLFEATYTRPDSMPLWRGPANNLAPCLEIQKEDYITVEGIRFQAALPIYDKYYGNDLWNKILLKMPSMTKDAISLSNDADNISIKQCYFLGTSMRKLFTGIEAGDNVDSLKIENCIFFGLADGAIKNANRSGKQSGFAVVNNTFYKCGYAMSFIDGCGATGCPGSDLIFANNIISSSSSGYAFSGPVPKKDCKMKIYNCVFYNLPKGIAFPPCLTKYYTFIDTLMRNPRFSSTNEAEYWNPDFMKPTLPAVLGGGLSTPFTPSVDFFSIIRDIPITIGAVEGAQSSVIKSLAKEAIAGIISPLAFKMYSNYPNPFRQATTIRFQIPGAENIITRIDIISLSGRLIKTLVNEHKSPGSYTVLWDGRDYNNHTIPGGIYLCQLKAGKYHDVKRMTLVE